MKKEYVNKIVGCLWIGFLISLVGYCTYSGFKGSDEDSKKGIPTEENITKWIERKIEWLSGRICEQMGDEVSAYKNRGEYCSEIFLEVYTKGKLVAQLNTAWFDVHRIPKDHRSLEGLVTLKDSLYCKERVRAWDNCPTGVLYRRGILLINGFLNSRNYPKNHHLTLVQKRVFFMVFGTSQNMIDKFYASYLTTDQVRRQLHNIPYKEVVKKTPAKRTITKKIPKPS